MTLSQQDRCKSMILGALVADAAAMGLHWIYDQQRIRDVAPDAPEFLTPNKQHYDGVPAFFAHPTRKSGALSQYGEQAMVMLRTVAAKGGHYNSAAFADQFRAHFGYGGAYVGYIDHATRDTIDNFRRFEDAAHACAQARPYHSDVRVPKTTVSKAIPLLMRLDGADLGEAFEAEIRKTYDDDAVVAYGLNLLEALVVLPTPTGASDIQLPAIAKLPALVGMLVTQGNIKVGAFDASVASAVRVTSDHPVAAQYGRISAHMMLGAVTAGNVEDAVLAGRKVANSDAAKLLDTATAMNDQDNDVVTKHFGMACDLPYGVPSAAHNISTATSFTEAVRRNIYGGGDTCGRAILVGAVMGAVYGVGGAQGIPEAWIDRLEVTPEAQKLNNALFS